jgi:hypothetical protein
MTVPFSAEEVALLHALYRAAPPDGPWMGWASVGATPSRVFILRRRADLRRLRLIKPDEGGFVLLDEDEALLWRGDSLEAFVAEAALRPTPFRS